MKYIILLVSILLNLCSDNLGQKLVSITIPLSSWENLKNLIHRADFDVIERRYSDNELTIICAAWLKGLSALEMSQINYTLLPLNRNRSVKHELPTTGYEKVTFLDYSNYDDIIKYLDALTLKKSKRKKVSVVDIGRSFQNRSLKMLCIDHTDATDIMFIDAGIHAREWLSVTTAILLIKTLIDSTDKFIVSVNWYIVPCVNPDGYVYSREQRSLHRKNTNFTNCLRKCKECGVDLNRNFDIHWGGSGTSSNPCSSSYGGAYAFSELESEAISDALLEYSQNIKLYLSLCGSSYRILYPWAYRKQKCDDWKDLKAAAKVAIKAMEKYNVHKFGYRTESAGMGWFPASGTSSDYAKAVAKIKYSYTMELQHGSKKSLSDPTHAEMQSYLLQNYVGIIALAEEVTRIKEEPLEDVTDFRPELCPKLAQSCVAIYTYDSVYFVSSFVFLIILN